MNTESRIASRPVGLHGDVFETPQDNVHFVRQEHLPWIRVGSREYPVLTGSVLLESLEAQQCLTTEDEVRALKGFDPHNASIDELRLIYVSNARVRILQQHFELEFDRAYEPRTS